MDYHRSTTAILLVDPYNDFISEGGKLWPRVKELGYHVTLVKDATAAFSQEAMHAAHAINGPTYAHAIVTTDELIPQLSA
jgi:nicotinamidase-related amidase